MNGVDSRHTAITLDQETLKSRGWLQIAVDNDGRDLFQTELLRIAKSLGEPVGTRDRDEPFQLLRPTDRRSAKRSSLSAIHSTGEFPLHVDTAHWPTPCRYILIGCINPGSAARATFLLDTATIPLTDAQIEHLHITPFRIVNGRESFFSTILSKSRTFIRYDPGCMVPTDQSGRNVLDILARKNWAPFIHSITWKPNDLIIVDNWRILHGRAATELPDSDRELVRIYVK